MLRHLIGDVCDAGAIVGHGVEEVYHAKAPHDVEAIHPRVRFETSDIDAFWTTVTGYAILAGIGIIVGILYFYFAYLSHYRARVSPPPLAIELHGNPMPPEPRIQESPRRDLEGQRAYEDSMLNNYNWVDRNKGVVAIPIERAMDLIVQKGIPPQTAPDDLKLFPPSTGDRGAGFEDKVEPEPR